MKGSCLALLVMMSGGAWAACGGASAPAPGYTDIAAGHDFPADEARLEALRVDGNLAEERRHVWQLFAGLAPRGAASAPPVFLTWHGTGEVFGDALALDASRRLDAAFAVATPRAQQSDATPPRIVRAWYNAAAFRCIRANRLAEASVLESLSRAATRSDATQGVDAARASVPTFPRDAAIVKTVWWPVPADGVAALPVWDAQQDPARPGGNDYPTWRRVVGVTARSRASGAVARADVDFLGRAFRGVRVFGCDAFVHIAVDAPLAAQLMAEPAAHKTALMVLGRPLRANDELVLVALHVATREIADWVWGTFWWHDAAERGRYAAQRPAALAGPWRNYLMDVAFDATLPRAADGTPHVAFNPWLEARLPDTGSGSGLVSNCTTCHRRAAWPAVEPFAVTRGAPALRAVAEGAAPGDPEGTATPLTTSSLWSLAMEAH